MQHFEVIVIGGGHAGTEAALAAARCGARTLLLTHNIETIGQLSCNPAIGGIGKGHLVREIDALGGIMGTAADLSGIQWRTLNASRGPAVRATRCQADRALYRAAVRRRVENQPGLHLFQEAADGLRVEGGRVTGVVTASGLGFTAGAVILTAGTFLAGRIHVGLTQQAGGRAGDAPATALAQALRELELPVGRLKTGTPPRLDGRSIDFERLLPQPGDEPPPWFSYAGPPARRPRQVPCWITHTNEASHAIIHGALDRSPLYSGAIQGPGPRYCPSIEDKVVRFADKDAHQVFLEPEGLDTHEVYPNGISTSLPFEVQQQLVRSIAGLERAHITRPGYAIEYDYFDPRMLQPSLESRALPGLWLAGQVNGTTGYEEAAAQGLIAGLNAARVVRGEAPWTPGREEAYIGVLIDDLIRLGASEPYRMFTSRAEYRLQLREDNADLRLSERGFELGVVSAERREAVCRKREAIEAEQARLGALWAAPGNALGRAVETTLGFLPAREVTALDLLRRPGVDYPGLMRVEGMGPPVACAEVAAQVEVTARYSGYLERQQDEIERNRRHGELPIPEAFDYSQVRGLSSEMQARFEQHRPATLGLASRLPGVTPAAISLLLVHLRRGQRRAG